MSLLTPQPKDTMQGNCVGHDNHSDDMESLDHCPDQLAVCDEVTKSTHSLMLVDTATDMGRPQEPLPLLGLDLVTNNCPVSRDIYTGIEDTDIYTSEGISTCNACGYTSLDKNDIISHIDTVHKNPDCNVCAPKCFGSCGREYSIVHRDTHSSSTDHSLASDS